MCNAIIYIEAVMTWRIGQGYYYYYYYKNTVKLYSSTVKEKMLVAIGKRMKGMNVISLTIY